MSVARQEIAKDPIIDMDLIRQNLEALFSYIQRVRQEIVSLNRSSDGIDKFTTMGEQLDAIVEATQDATDAIMDAVEKNGEAVAKLQETLTDETHLALLDSILENNNTVLESCSFQDITGQRVTKIIKSVTYVEDRVNTLIDVWGRDELSKVKVETDEGLTEEQKILKGPQRSGEGISQDEIDKLFD